MQDERERLRAAGFSDAEIDAELGPKRPTIRRPAAESTTMQGPGKAPERAARDAAFATGLARQAGQGATLGFADEIEARVRSAFGGGPYQAVRDRVRAANDQFQQENPGTALAANIAGGLLTGGAAAGAAKGAGALGSAARVLAPRVEATAGLAQRVGQAAKVGGITGALGGAGVADEMRDIPQSAGVGALVGGVAGGALAGVGDAFRGGRNLAARIGQGQKDAGAIRRAIRADSPEESGARRVLRRAGSQGMTLDDVAARAEAADGPDVLAEVLGPKGVRDLRTARALGFQAPGEIEDGLLTRARNDVNAVRQSVRRELGEQVDDVAFRDAKRIEAQQAAGPLFGQALEGVTISDPRMVAMLQRPAIASAYGTARKMAANDGVQLPPIGAIVRGAAGRADDMADEVVGGTATAAARTDSGGLRDVSKVATSDLLDEFEALTTRQQRDMGQSVYNFVETNQGGGNYGVVVPTATTRPGGGPSMQAKAQRRVDQTNGVLDRITAELERRGVDWAEALGKRASGEADDIVDDVARVVPGRGTVSLPDEAAAPALPSMSGQRWQYVKHALDDQLAELEGRTGGTATKRYAQLMQARNDVDALLYEFANQGEDGASLWGAANQAYARPMQEADAFAEGVRGGRGIQPPDVPRLLSGDAAASRARGVANTIQDDLARLGRDEAAGAIRNPAPVLMGSDAADARLMVAAGGDEAKVGRLREQARNVGRRLQTRQQVIGGSQTFDKFADAAEQGMAPGDLLQAAQSPTTAALRALGRGANALQRNVVGQDMDAMARLLMSGAPGQMSRREALARLRELEPAISALMARQAMMRGTLGGATGRAAAGGS